MKTCTRRWKTRWSPTRPARDFVALDAMIRRYQTRCDELDGKPPEDKNRFRISPVGNRWASTGDHDALERRHHQRGHRGRDRSARPRRPALGHATPRGRAARGSAGTSSTAVRVRPRTANDPTSRSPSRSNHSSAGSSRRPGDLSLASSQISELLCDSKLQIIVTGADGKPLDVGAAVYRPSRKTPTSGPPPRSGPVPISRLRPHPRPSPPRHPVPRRPHRPREPRLLVRLPPPRPPQTRLARDLRRHHLHRHQPRPPTYRQHLNASHQLIEGPTDGRVASIIAVGSRGGHERRRSRGGRCRSAH